MSALREPILNYFTGGYIAGSEEEVAVSVARGELVAVVGSTGSGKTRMVERLYEWTCQRQPSGRLWFAGMDMAELSFRERREDLSSGLAFVVRDSKKRATTPGVLPGARVREELEVRLGESAAVTSLLSALGAAAPESAFGRPLDELPAEDRTRAAVALALALDPEVLCIDDPFKGVPLLRMMALADDIARQKSRCGMIVMMRDLALAARMADRIAVMDRGAIVDFGVPEDILAGSLHSATRALLASARQRPSP